MHWCRQHTARVDGGGGSQLLVAVHFRKCVTCMRVHATFQMPAFFQGYQRKTRLPEVCRLVLPSPSFSLSLFLSPPSLHLVRTTLVMSYWHKRIHVAHPQPSGTSIFFFLVCVTRSKFLKDVTNNRLHVSFRQFKINFCRGSPGLHYGHTVGALAQFEPVSPG